MNARSNYVRQEQDGPEHSNDSDWVDVLGIITFVVGLALLFYYYLLLPIATTLLGLG